MSCTQEHRPRKHPVLPDGNPTGSNSWFHCNSCHSISCTAQASGSEGPTTHGKLSGSSAGGIDTLSNETWQPSLERSTDAPKKQAKNARKKTKVQECQSDSNLFMQGCCWPWSFLFALPSLMSSPKSPVQMTSDLRRSEMRRDCVLKSWSRDLAKVSRLR